MRLFRSRKDDTSVEPCYKTVKALPAIILEDDQGPAEMKRSKNFLKHSIESFNVVYYCRSVLCLLTVR